MKLIINLLFVISLFGSLDAKEKKKESCEEVFSRIYENGLWGYNEEDGTPSSGWGSWLSSVEPYKKFLEGFLKENAITSVTDVGCGDWIFSRHINWDHITYVGIDVVKSVIERNQKEFSKPNIHFVHQDILQADLPKAELLVCKDVLQHLNNEEVATFLQKLKEYKHCLITNDIVVGDQAVGKVNKDLPGPGQNRPLDLTKAPFNLKAEKVLTYQARDDHVKQVLYIKN
jgi:SAM-dependent methyltransferase